MDIYPVESSVIEELGYSYWHAMLYVKLHSGLKYFYHDVPEHLMEQFLLSSSYGSFYNRKIKGVYFSMPCFIDPEGN